MNNALESAILDPLANGTPRLINFGGLTVDLSGYSLAVDGRDVQVTLTEFLLLAALMEHPYHVLRRETLAAILPLRPIDSRALPGSLRTVDIHISRLRRKLQVEDCYCIQTIRFVGYRFIPPGTPAPPKSRPEAQGTAMHRPVSEPAATLGS
jgi:DNA-binding response OmpR family regulator